MWQKYLPLALLGILRPSQTSSVDIPAPYFLLPPTEEFLRLYAFSQLRRAILSADLLSLGQYWILKFMWFLPIPYTQEAFIVCPLAIYKGLLLLLLGALTGSWP